MDANCNIMSNKLIRYGDKYGKIEPILGKSKKYLFTEDDTNETITINNIDNADTEPILLRNGNIIKYRKQYVTVNEIYIENKKIKYNLKDVDDDRSLLDVFQHDPGLSSSPINKQDEPVIKKTIDFVHKFSKYNKEITTPYVYDDLVGQCRLTIQQLYKIMQMQINTRCIDYNITNIIKMPYSFITPAFQLIPFDKCELIERIFDLTVSFETKCKAFCYDYFSRNNISYAEPKQFYDEFAKYCAKYNKKAAELRKQIVDAICIQITVQGHLWVTTHYLYNMEKTMGDDMLNLYYETMDTSIDEDDIYDLIAKYEDKQSINLNISFTFNIEQKQAIVQSMINRASIIEGPPGTGKSTIMDCFLWIYKEYGLSNINQIPIYQDDVAEPIGYTEFIDVVVMAPTGKAFANLFEKVKHHNISQKISGTIHKMVFNTFPHYFKNNLLIDEICTSAVNELRLDIEFVKKYIQDALTRPSIFTTDAHIRYQYERLRKFVLDNEYNNKMANLSHYKLSIGLIIVEEASMVDNELFKQVLKWCNYFDCRLVIIGDSNQLPSVGPGCVLNQLVTSGYFVVNRLTTIKRQETGCLLTNIKKLTSGMIRHRDFDGVTMQILSRESFILPKTNISKQELNREKFRILLETEIRSGTDPKDIKCLAYYSKNTFAFSTQTLNKELQLIMNNNKPIIIPNTKKYYYDYDEFRVGDIIVRTKNDYSDENHFHANGEEAVIIDYDMDNMLVHVRYNYDDPSIPFTTHSVNELYELFSLSYALTIHKSQGSQYPCVIVFIDNSYFCDKKALYTAISRAQKKCIIVTDYADFDKIQRKLTIKPSLFMRHFNEYEQPL